MHTNISSSTDIFILHLSDLHFTGTTGEARLWYDQLSRDLGTNLRCNKLDALILSGDIANLNKEAEYVQAEEFLSRIVHKFGTNRKNIVIVPGNHDLNWSLADSAYPTDYKTWEEEGKPKEQPDGRKHKERFRLFADFFGKATGRYFDLEYENQGLVWDLEELDLLILGLNSAWKLDRRKTEDADINHDALTKAFETIERIDGNERRLKIAVWHHPLTSDRADKNDFIHNKDFLQRLKDRGFRLALHGHIHKADTAVFNPTGHPLSIIAAGTFEAPTGELTPGHPWQYNLLQIPENDRKLDGELISEDDLIVHIRRRQDDKGEWFEDVIWKHDNSTKRFAWYKVSNVFPRIPPRQPRLAPPEEGLYTLLGQELLEGKLIFFLGADINLCGRPSNGRGGGPESWEDADGKPRHPPSNWELAGYLDRTLDPSFHDAIDCFLCNMERDRLPKSCPLLRGHPRLLAQVSQHGDATVSPDSAISLSNRLFNRIFQPNPVHKFLVQLPALLKSKSDFKNVYPLIVTTCFDDTLEQAFKNNPDTARQFDVISFGREDEEGKLSFYHYPKGKPTTGSKLVKSANADKDFQKWDKRSIILRLFGGTAGTGQFVVTEDHFIRYLAQTELLSALPLHIQPRLTDSHIIFLGYTPIHWYQRAFFQSFWGKYLAKKDRKNPRWLAIHEVCSKIDEALWRHYGAEPYEVSLQRFVEALQSSIRSI